jgi:hypothetical protein
MGKGLLFSKTMWFNVLTALTSIAVFVQDSSFVADHPEAVSAIGIGVGIINVILRLITKEPITKVV